MYRALQLANQGTKLVKDNPNVGAVLVYNNRIIGEGYHREHGKAHAEVNCINSVEASDQKLIPYSTIYITLEPCFHEGKTPPCVALLIKQKIKHIVVGTLDPNPKVSGQSIEKLRSLSVEVTVGVLQEECKKMIQPFVKMMNKEPWVILKFAKSKFNFMASSEGQVWLSNKLSKLYVHRLRANADGIMIATNTAKTDNPSLTTRLVDGENPIRIVLDRQGVLSDTLAVFNDGNPTIYVCSKSRSLTKHIDILIHNFDQANHLQVLLKKLYTKGIYRIIIEGGAALLQSIVKNNLWDEATLINTEHHLNEGKLAPNIMGKVVSKTFLDSDTVYNIRQQQIV